MTTLALFIPLPLLLIGIVIMRWGYRGVRLDAHPICRRCGFDLIGLPAGVRVCSECGSNLNRHHATRFGNRRRRRWTILAGAAPAFLSLAWIATCGFVLLGSANPHQYKPLWWLIFEGDSSDLESRTVAFREVLRRQRNAGLTQQHIDRLADHCLRLQRDTDRPWIAEWGLLLEAFHKASVISPERWEQYLQNALESSLVIEPRATVVQGDPLPVAIWFRPARIGSLRRLIGVAECEVDHVEIARSEPELVSLYLNPISQRPVIERKLLEAPYWASRLPPGEHIVGLRLRPTPPFRVSGESTLPATIDLHAKFEIREPAHSPIQRIVDETHAEAVRKSMRIKLIRRDGRIMLEAQIVRPPVPLSYRVIVRTSNGELSGPRLCCPAGKSEYIYESVDCGETSATVADVILEPTPDAIVRTVNMTRYWNHPIHFHVVRIE